MFMCRRKGDKFGILLGDYLNIMGNWVGKGTLTRESGR